jgi:hypothetical protein
MWMTAKCNAAGYPINLAGFGKREHVDDGEAINPTF